MFTNGMAFKHASRSGSEEAEDVLHLAMNVTSAVSGSNQAGVSTTSYTLLRYNINKQTRPHHHGARITQDKKTTLLS